MKPADRKRVQTAFRKIRDLISSKWFPYLSETSLELCKRADTEHRRSDRQYAHVMHINNVICAADAIADLERGNLYGVLLHEFGHLIVEHEWGDSVPESEQEDAADGAIFRAFGIPIGYDAGQPTVEWADPKLVDRKIMDAKMP
jgi:hypothetical protein